MRHLCRHADALAQHGVRMNRLADAYRISAYFDGQRNLANHVARMRADHAAAQDLAVTVRLWAVIKKQFGDPFVAAVGNGAALGRPGEQALLDLDALGFSLILGEADPGHFGVGVGHAGDDAGVEGGGPEFLGRLFVTLHQFTSNHSSGHMRFVHRFVRQYGLADDVTDGEDVRHVGAHLNIDIDKAAIGNGNASFFSGNFFAVGRTAYGLQRQVVELRCGGRNACVASFLALLCRLKRHVSHSRYGMVLTPGAVSRTRLLPHLSGAGARAGRAAAVTAVAAGPSAILNSSIAKLRSYMS